MPETTFVGIEMRDGLIYLIYPDGSEWYLDSWERLVRIALGEFNE